MLIFGPANTRNRPNADLMLGQRRRRWPNIKSTLGQPFVRTGSISHTGHLLCVMTLSGDHVPRDPERDLNESVGE